MTTYFINFIICSGLLLLVYRVFLGHENLYRFNRFYLLFSLVFSLTVPLITIQVPHMELPVFQSKRVDQPLPKAPVNIVQPTIAEQITPVITEAPEQTEAVTQAALVQVNVPVQQPVAQTPVNIDYRYILLALYSIAMLIMLVRFIRNSWKISRLVTKNTIVNYEDTSLVLVDDKVTPHSFLKYVFINKDDYQSGAIEPEIICHEQAHIKQLHSLDVLFVELLQVVLWFNPFIPFYRKAMQLNHEFLADEEVIKNYHDTPAYQYLLLAKASQSGSMYLTSQFNYQVTKKRIIMMTKNTSAKIALYKQLALVPVLAGALLLFCHKVIAQKASPKTAHVEKNAPVNKIDISSTWPDSLEWRKGLPQPYVRHPFNYPFTKAGASEAVLKEYAAIAGKYSNDRAYDNLDQKIPTLLPAERTRLEQLFAQMSPKQQNAQKLGFTIFHGYTLTQPTQEVYDKWKTSNYRVFIDGKPFALSELDKHQPNEFYHYMITREIWFSKTNYPYAISLKTKTAFDRWNKRMEGIRIVYNYKYPDGTVRQYAGYGKYDAPKELKVAAPRQTGVNKSNENVIPYAKTDAPQSVLDEYTAILKKNNIPYKKGDKVNVTPDFSAADRERLITLYKQMSDVQQQHQYIRIANSYPRPVTSITEQDLKEWQDPVKYGVWIDAKRINNAELAKYKASDLKNSDYRRLKPQEVISDKVTYRVDLMTKPYLARYFNPRVPKVLLLYVPKERWKNLSWHIAGVVMKTSQQDRQAAQQVTGNANKSDVASKLGALKGIKIRGEVAYPGDYVLQNNNVLECLKAAGGIKPSGSIENIEVFRGGARVNIDFASVNSKDILLPGDSVYVSRIR